MQNAEQHRLPAAAELAGRVVRLERAGLGRAEIAAELGVGLDALARMERKSARLAGALARAAEAERAWWEAQPREALAAGAPLNMSAWFAAMQWRFGAAGAAAASGLGGAGEAAAADEPARPRAIYILPDNGKERRAPDGTPMTPALRKARTLAPIQGEIDRLEARLAHFRELLSEYATDDYEDHDDDDGDGDDGWDGDAPDEWDEQGGWGDEDDDRDEDDEDDGDDGDDDDHGDELGDEDGEARGGAAGGEPGVDDVGGDGGVAGSDGDGPQPIPRGPTAPAEDAGPPAWAAQPHFGAGGPGDPAGVRDAPGGELLGTGVRLAR